MTQCLLQSPAESISTYIAELQQLEQHCNFPNLEEMLCDYLVCGLHDEDVRCKELTFQNAQQEALSPEAAAISTWEVQLVRSSPCSEIHVTRIKGPF